MLLEEVKFKYNWKKEMHYNPQEDLKIFVAPMLSKLDYRKK